MEILATLFGSKERVRIMRYALANDKIGFDAKVVSERLKLDIVNTRRELKLLAKATFLKEGMVNVEYIKQTKKETKIEKKKVNGYKLNTTFIYLPNFKNLLLEKEELAPSEVYEHFKKLGKIDLFLLSGVFQGRNGKEVDMVIVGKNLKKSKIEDKIGEIEGFLGAEIKYAIYDSEEFSYRYMMYDRFVRSLLVEDHILVVDNLKLR